LPAAPCYGHADQQAQLLGQYFARLMEPGQLD
jgi:hypothetical protein